MDSNKKLTEVVIKYFLMTSAITSLIDELSETHVYNKTIKFHANQLKKELTSKPFADKYSLFFDTEEKGEDSVRVIACYEEYAQIIAALPPEYLPSLLDGMKSAISRVPGILDNLNDNVKSLILSHVNNQEFQDS